MVHLPHVDGRRGCQVPHRPDLKATHTYGDDQKVLLSTETMTVAVTGSSFTYTFPAHSLTILRVKGG
ncbi:MAG: hypothetical protein HQ485_07680 [Acidobacteria bacterium]|nr:hypothetical protein [Acidobacteriota bacterium]